jgi:hypothetical protein
MFGRSPIRDPGKPNPTFEERNMDRTKTLACALLGCVLLAVPALAQEGNGMPAMGPTAELKELSPMEGEWTAEMQVRQGPDAPWMSSPATCSITSEMEGCIQRTHFESSMMGMPFQGEQTLTYNREKKQFETIWIDSMSARPSYATGHYEDGKLVMTGDDEMMGQPYKMRVTTVMTGNDKMDWVMEMSMDGGKTWWEGMKMTYTKKGS